MLEDRNVNITTQLSSIIKVFSNFRLVAQIKEEIEKVKPSLIPAIYSLLSFSPYLKAVAISLARPFIVAFIFESTAGNLLYLFSLFGCIETKIEGGINLVSSR